MSVLLQFVCAFPIFFLALRRFKWGLGGVFVLVCVLQWAVMLAQKQVRFPAPGSIFLWYLVPLAVGVWIGLNWSAWPEVWRRARLPLFLLFIATMYWFLDVCVRQIGGLPYTSDEYKWSHTLFTVFGSMVLLGLSLHWKDAKSWWEKLFRTLGENSLQLYLIHPMLLTLLAGPTALKVLKPLPFAPVWVVLILVAVSYALGLVVRHLGLDRWMFGRDSRTAPAKPAVTSGA
jgi:peptidoglycan/LPS O-acetylase OafA/YrhL